MANDQLRGKTLADQASVMQWANYADSELYHLACSWLDGPDKGTSERAKAELKKNLKALDSYLLHHTYLVGERVSLADIALATSLLGLYQKVINVMRSCVYSKLTFFNFDLGFRSTSSERIYQCEPLVHNFG